MKELIVYTGLDGSGKSTRFEKYKNQNYKTFYEPTNFREKSLLELMNIYKEYDILDRFFPLDEIVYAPIFKVKSKITFKETIKVIEDILQFKDRIIINIGFNTPREYEFIHIIRKEKYYPDYSLTVKNWIKLIKRLEKYFKNNERVILKYFWYNMDITYQQLLKLVSQKVFEEKGVNEDENK